jgi:Ni/Fe-hydrogenase 1 B-type cytochrome subunit
MATTRGIPIVADQPPEQCLARVYVWQLPVRVSHWLIFFAIISLSFTGYYMHNPFIISRAPTTYMMGTMRYIHIISGYIFLAAFMMRVYYFVAGNYWASWRFFVPTDRQRLKTAREMFKYYSFLRREPVRQVGHNALAGMTYSFIFFLMALEILTGLVLYSQVRGPGLARTLFGWVPGIIDIQYLRLFHFLCMFAFIAFAIHHVYSAILVSIEERNGLLESMFSGFKFVQGYELEEQEQRRQILLKTSLPSRIARWWSSRKKKGA